MRIYSVDLKIPVFKSRTYTSNKSFGILQPGVSGTRRIPGGREGRQMTFPVLCFPLRSFLVAKENFTRSYCFSMDPQRGDGYGHGHSHVGDRNEVGARLRSSQETKTFCETFPPSIFPEILIVFLIAIGCLPHEPVSSD